MRTASAGPWAIVALLAAGSARGDATVPPASPASAASPALEETCVAADLDERIARAKGPPALLGLSPVEVEALVRWRRLHPGTAEPEPDEMRGLLDSVRSDVASGRHREDELTQAVPGRYTGAGRREMVVVLYRGTAHHDGAQAWLLRDLGGRWTAVREVAESCSMQIARFPVGGRAPDLLLVDQSCMHQGHDDGEALVLSLRGHAPRTLHGATFALPPAEHADTRRETHRITLGCEGAPRSIQLVDRAEIVEGGRARRVTTTRTLRP